MEYPMRIVPPSKDDKMLSMLIYSTSLFTAIIGPMVIWLLKKDESEFIDYHGKEYINFFISYTVYMIIGSFLIFAFIGLLILAVFGLMYLVFTIIAAVQAFNGEYYRIPLVIRIIK